jgi:metal-responsive CopG/Arc/MetJ family transcriptional regulator
MATVKTAISLDGELFLRAEGAARRLRVSRSRLFSTALEEFLERRRNRELLERINAAHQEPDPAERKLLRAMRRRQGQRLQKTW